MQHNVQEAMQKYQIHKTDTGSTSVQGKNQNHFSSFISHFLLKLCLVAIASEKIQNLTRHLTRFPLDNVAKRSFQVKFQNIFFLN